MRPLRLPSLVVVLGALASCHDFPAAYDDCVARGACPGGPGAESTLALDEPRPELRTVATEPITGTFSLRNLGPGTVEQVDLTSTDTAIFSLHEVSCAGGALAPDASCTFDVTFTPTAVGEADAGLRINAAGAALLDVRLFGTATGPLAISPTSLDFQKVNVGEHAALPFTLTNLSALVSTGLLHYDAGPAFAIDSADCPRLDAGASCLLQVTFSPTTDGDAGATLDVSGAPAQSGGRPAEHLLVPLSAVALPPAALEFGAHATLEADLGMEARGTITVTNKSSLIDTGALRFELLGDSAGVFTLDASACGTLPAKGACALGLRFKADVYGTYGAQLEGLLPDGGASITTLTAKAYDRVPLNLSLSAAALDAGCAVTFDAGASVGAGTCPGTCQTSVRRGVAVVVQAVPGNRWVLRNWQCPSGVTVGLQCVTTPRNDAGVTVTPSFAKEQHTLTLTASDPHRIDTVPYGGQACTSSPCSFIFDFDVSATILAQGLGGRTLQALGGDCGGAVNCSLNMTADHPVPVTFTTARTAFVSHTVLSGGGLAAADQACANEAADAGLPGSSWKAFLATSTQSAFSRLTSTGGWVRPDGLVVAASLSELQALKLRAPIALDAWGQPTFNAQPATGMRSDGGVAGTCGDWLATVGTTTGSSVIKGGAQWLEYPGLGSCSSATFYCFSDSSLAVPVLQDLPSGAHRGFVTSALFDGNTSDAVLTAACVADASDAGLADAARYLALHEPDDGGTVAALFGGSSDPFFRLDGAPYVPSAYQLFEGSIAPPTSFLNLTAAGQVVDGPVWVRGCLRTGGAATAGNTQGVSDLYFNPNATALSCASTARAWCMVR